MKKCVIMRGVSGAGKSSFLERHFPDFRVCSADNYFVTPNGVYVFEAAKLQEAHLHCLREFVADVTHGRPLLAVDNTNLRVAELAPYYQVAAAHGYAVHMFFLVVSPSVAAARSLHGVPYDKIVQGASSAEALTPWFQQHLLTPDMLPHFDPQAVVFA